MPFVGRDHTTSERTQELAKTSHNKTKNARRAPFFVTPREFCWNYQKHSRSERVVYDRIFDGIIAGDRKIPLSVQDAPGTEDFSDFVKRIFHSVTLDHPELFWVNWFSLAYEIEGNEIRAALIPDYNDAFDERDEIQRQIEETIAPILAATAKTDDPFEKELIVFAWIRSHLVYDSDAEDDQTLADALLQKRTVCGGFSAAFQYLMIRSGVSTTTITGTGNEPHAWNLIRVDGQCYNVDATASYTSSDDDPLPKKAPTFWLYNLTDEQYESEGESFRDSKMGDEHVMELQQCNTPFSFVDAYSDDVIVDIYEPYVSLSSRTVVKTLDEYWKIALETALAAPGREFTITVIVSGKDLLKAIQTTNHKAREKNYLVPLWKGKYANCNNKRLLTSLRIASDTWLLVDFEKFTSCR